MLRRFSVLDVKSALALKVREVRKRFPSGDFYIDVLRGIDLEAKKGEILMITGPSGGGKTTLLSILAGTFSFDSGEVTIFGESLKDMDDQQKTELRRKHIGFIFQQFHLIKTISTLENISIPLILNGWDNDEALKKAAEMLAKVGLKGKETLNPSHLSVGEQQRVAIARALIHNPELLVCDEPTASLDAENGVRVMQLLTREARTPERCVVMVTHDNRILKYADRIALMEDGVIIGYRAPPKG